MISDKSLGNDVYADFSGFESMRTAARRNDPAAVHKVAKQLEGVFLNMMMSSMREANQLFNDDSLMSSKDVRFYEQMLDQQLSVTLTEGKGIGLADQITKQIAALQGRQYDPENGEVPNIGNPGSSQPDSKHEKAKPDLNIDIYRARVMPVQQQSPKSLFAHETPLFKDKANQINKPERVAQVVDVADRQFEALSPTEFVEKVLPFAKKASAKLGVPTESIVAQAALETGWGRHMMKHENGSSAFNFFGIKAGSSWQGDTVKVPTLEYRNGVAAEETASFRSYLNMDAAFKDYVEFLSQKPRYQQALAEVRNNKDAKSWGEALQQAGYATDPNYGKKIASIVARLQKDDAFQQQLTLAAKSKP